jgi:hypothetical protein
MSVRPFLELGRLNMRTFAAILRAADHIERNPRLFDFGRTRVPHSCRTRGCALGWIGFFAGRTKLPLRTLFGFSLPHRGIAIVTTEGGSDPLIPITACEFYRRMDALVAPDDWRREASACAAGLRLYAMRYHRPEQWDPAYLAFRSTILEEQVGGTRQLQSRPPAEA